MFAQAARDFRVPYCLDNVIHDRLQTWEADCMISIVVVGSSSDGRENQGFPTRPYSCELFINQMMQRKVDKPDVCGLKTI